MMRHLPSASLRKTSRPGSTEVTLSGETNSVQVRRTAARLPSTMISRRSSS